MTLFHRGYRLEVKIVLSIHNFFVSKELHWDHSTMTTLENKIRLGE